MSNKRLGVLAGLLLLVFLISQIPSRVIAVILPATVTLEGFGGTLWEGQAARSSVLLGNKQFQLGRLDWSLQPLSLLTLNPTLTVASQWGSQRFAGDVSLGLSGKVEIEDLSASIDIGFSRHLMPLYVGGVFQADIRHLTLINNLPSRVDGRLVWQDGVWTARSGDVALGNYVLELAGTDGDIGGRVMTLSGPLKVEGTLALTHNAYNVAMALTGPATRNDGLRQSLMLLAAPVADGFDMQLEGTL